MSSTSGYTDYYRIYKPATTERYDISKFWEAADIIDQQMHDNQYECEFVGATSTNDGVTGNVPGPVSGEEGYVLFGDGTWKDILANIDFTQLSAQQIADLKTALGI